MSSDVLFISKKFGTSQIYISHNIGLILETCDRVFVMYSGGKRVLNVDGMKKYYEVKNSPFMALITGRTARFVKANAEFIHVQ